MSDIHEISTRIRVGLPDDYQRHPLPGARTWCEALKSGKYLKGKGKLCNEVAHDEFRYCCLGVLSCVQGRLRLFEEQMVVGTGAFVSFWADCAGPDEYSSPSALHYTHPTTSEFFGNLGEWPDEVEVLVSENGGPDWDDLNFHSLADLNDWDDGGSFELVTFNDIADIIELLWYDPEHEQP